MMVKVLHPKRMNDERYAHIDLNGHTYVCECYSAEFGQGEVHKTAHGIVFFPMRSVYGRYSEYAFFNVPEADTAYQRWSLQRDWNICMPL